MEARLWRAVCTGAAALAASAAQAVELRPLLRSGVDFGGDALITAVLVTGDTEKVRANDGLYLAGGAAVLSEDRSLEVELSVGYKSDRLWVNHGRIDWTMVPVEALAFARIANWRLGGGLAWHLWPRLDASDVPGGSKIGYKDALGVVLQADYSWNARYAIGARYTGVRYKPNGGGPSVDSGGLGLVFTGWF
jgi:hypothetical protein